MSAPVVPIAAAPSPAVSIIVPAFGVSDLIGEALGSLVAQRFSDWEAIVVDDGDPKVEPAIERFMGDPRVRLLGTGNGGISAARNRAAAVARAPLIAMLDGDDAWLPLYLERMIAALDHDPDCGFATCDAIYFGEGPRVGRRFSEFLPQRAPITLAGVITRQTNIFTGCIIRRAAFESVGGLDESLRAAEDLDLWIRLLGAGYAATIVAEPLVRYRRRPGSLSAHTTTLLEATARVYANAAERLRGRTEAALADAMRSKVESQLGWEEGETLVRHGRAREGVRRLRRAGAHRRSLRWRVAMPLMSLFPSLARPMLGYRDRESGA